MKETYSPSSFSSIRYSQFVLLIVIAIQLYLFTNLTLVNALESVLQLPRSLSSRYRPRTRRVIYVDEYGAKGDGLQDDTKAFRDAWRKACSFSSRATIVVRAGNIHLVHPTEFFGPCRSRMILRIHGTLIAPESPDAWKGFNPRKWLYFSGVNHLNVDGGGTIDGMGREWWLRSCKINTTNPCRHAPTAIMFHRCNKLKIKNLMVNNSQQMHIEFTNSVGVIASNLTVIAPAYSPNTDGIHISASTRIHIKNSIIRTGDDCISIVNNSSRIRISNIVCGPGHGISIGSLGKSNSWAQVHHVTVDGAFLSNTDNGLRIKTWQGGGGFASNIIFQNVYMDNVSNPIIIDQYYCDSPLSCANQTSGVKVENISFKGISGSSGSNEAIRFACSDAVPCERILLENVVLTSSVEGEICRSFCWEARGSSHGIVLPTPCFSTQNLIHQKIAFNSVLHAGS